MKVYIFDNLSHYKLIFRIYTSDPIFSYVDIMSILRMLEKTGAMSFVLPFITIVAIALMFAIPGLFGINPHNQGITGMEVLKNFSEAGNDTGNAEGVEVIGGRVDAQIRLSAPDHQVIPVDAVVNVLITGASTNVAGLERKASMGIEEFIQLSGKPFKRSEGKLYAIDYEGPGFIGQNHTVDLSDFTGLDRLVPPGQYMLKTEVTFEGKVITSRERMFDVA